MMMLIVFTLILTVMNVAATENDYENVTISGTLLFSGDATTKTLPPSSCAVIKVSDRNKMDVPEILLATTTIDVSNKTLTEGIPYTISLRRPNDFFLPHSIDARVNNGWCSSESDSSGWIKRGDYLIAHSHRLKLDYEEESYEKDIKLDYYDHEIIVTVSGTLLFAASTTITLAPSSCAVIKVSDANRMDVAAILLATKTISNVTNTNFAEGIPYTISFERPNVLGLPLSIDARVNNGWCSSKNESYWIKEGDYLNTRYYHFKLENGKETYEEDVELEFHD